MQQSERTSSSFPFTITYLLFFLLLLLPLILDSVTALMLYVLPLFHHKAPPAHHHHHLLKKRPVKGEKNIRVCAFTDVFSQSINNLVVQQRQQWQIAVHCSLAWILSRCKLLWASLLVFFLIIYFLFEDLIKVETARLLEKFMIRKRSPVILIARVFKLHLQKRVSVAKVWTCFSN